VELVNADTWLFGYYAGSRCELTPSSIQRHQIKQDFRLWFRCRNEILFFLYIKSLQVMST
jgi:hypothetical protein